MTSLARAFVPWSSGCRIRALAAAAAVLVVAGVSTACSSSAGAPTSGPQVDCFGAPPGDFWDGTGTTASRPVSLRLVNGYLKTVPDDAGIVVTAHESVAVGFTSHGCAHRRAVAHAASLSLDQVAVFRAAHSAVEASRLHNRMIDAIRHHRLDDVALGLVSFGPGRTGVEEVGTTRRDLDTVRATLAHVLTHDDTSYFAVRKGHVLGRALRTSASHPRWS